MLTGSTFYELQFRIKPDLHCASICVHIRRDKMKPLDQSRPYVVNLFMILFYVLMSSYKMESKLLTLTVDNSRYLIRYQSLLA